MEEAVAEVVEEVVEEVVAGMDLRPVRSDVTPLNTLTPGLLPRLSLSSLCPSLSSLSPFLSLSLCPSLSLSISAWPL